MLFALLTFGSVFLARAAIDSSRANRSLREANEEAAFVAALGGDVETAVQRIDEAERLGAEPNWLSKMRGQVHLLRGEYLEAVGELEEAWNRRHDGEEDREAYFLLSRAVMESGAEPRYIGMAEAAKGMAATTFKEQLFKGMALYWYDRYEALEELNKSVDSNPLSPVARVYRAHVQSLVAMDTGNLSDIELAIRDIDAALRFMDNASVVIAQHTRVHLSAAQLFKRAGDAQRAESELRIAETSAKRLAQYPNADHARQARTNFFEVIGDSDQMLAAATPPDGMTHQVAYLAGRHAAELFRLRRHDEALVAIRRARPTELDDYRWVEAFVQMEDPTKREQAGREFVAHLKRNTEWHDYWFTVYDWPALRLLQLDYAEERAKEAYREATPNIRPFPEYMLSDGSDEAVELFLSQYEGKLWFTTVCHFLIGVDQLARGQRDKAIHHLGMCQETGNFRPFAVPWSRAFLERMESDPEWPDWIERVEFAPYEPEGSAVAENEL